MIRALLLILPLAAATCGPNASGPAPPDSDVPPELMTETEGEWPELMTDDEETTPRRRSSNDAAWRYAGSPAVGVWQLTRVGADDRMSAATITWSFRADGTGTYEQNVKNIGFVNMDAADAARTVHLAALRRRRRRRLRWRALRALRPGQDGLARRGQRRRGLRRVALVAGGGPGLGGAPTAHVPTNASSLHAGATSAFATASVLAGLPRPAPVPVRIASVEPGSPRRHAGVGARRPGAGRQRRAGRGRAGLPVQGLRGVADAEAPQGRPGPSRTP